MFQIETETYYMLKYLSWNKEQDNWKGPRTDPCGVPTINCVTVTIREIRNCYQHINTMLKTFNLN